MVARAIFFSIIASGLSQACNHTQRTSSLNDFQRPRGDIGDASIIYQEFRDGKSVVVLKQCADDYQFTRSSIDRQCGGLPAICAAEMPAMSYITKLPASKADEYFSKIKDPSGFFQASDFPAGPLWSDLIAPFGGACSNSVSKLPHIPKTHRACLGTMDTVEGRPAWVYLNLERAITKDETLQPHFMLNVQMTMVFNDGATTIERSHLMVLNANGNGSQQGIRLNELNNPRVRLGLILDEVSNRYQLNMYTSSDLALMQYKDETKCR